MDALSLLRKDHRTVEALFKQFEKGKGSKKEIVRRIIKELATHAAIEVQIFYPAVRKASEEASKRDDAEQMVLEALEEHHIVKWTLEELGKMSPSDERFEAKATVLMESVRHHVKEEQDDLFPKVERLIEPAELRELGRLLEKAKKTAPTRAHPRAPDAPPGNLVAGSMAAMADRMADGAGAMIDKLGAKAKSMRKRAQHALQ